MNQRKVCRMLLMTYRDSSGPRVGCLMVSLLHGEWAIVEGSETLVDTPAWWLRVSAFDNFPTPDHSQVSMRKLDLPDAERIDGSQSGEHLWARANRHLN